MNKRQELLERIKHLPADKQAALFEQFDKKNGDATIPVIDSQTPAPASYAQLGLWNIYELEGKNDKYNMPSAYQIRNVLNIDALVKSFEYLVARHQTLRTSFAKIDGELYQTIHHADSFALEIVDLEELSEEEQTRQAYDLIENAGAVAFDLETGPLFAVSLIRISEDFHILQMCAHHIVFDGWSKGVLLKELQVCYQQFSQSESGLVDIALPALPIQFTDFAHWERKQQYLDEQVTFWADKLRHAPHHLNIGDLDNGGSTSANGYSVPIRLHADLSQQLKALGRKAGCSPFMTMLATFALMLSRFSQQQEVLIGTPVDNRRQKELAGLIGYFLNTTVLDIEIDEHLSFSEFLECVKQVCTQAYAKQEAPFNRVVEAVNPIRSLNVTPLFQAMFVFQVAGASEFSLPGLDIKQIDNEKVDIRELDKLTESSQQALEAEQFIEFKTHTKYDLYLTFIEEQDGSFGGWLSYDKNLMSQQYIQSFLVHYIKFLGAIVEHHNTPLQQVQISSDADQRLLHGVNQTFYEHPEALTLGQAFERQAGKTPDAIATIFDGQQRTYQQLNQDANQLANYLSQNQVKRGDVIALLMPRCSDAIACMLAIFKLGAVYLPLDPKLPAARLAQYLRSAQAHSIISTTHQAGIIEAMAEPQHVVFIDAIATLLDKSPVNAPDVDLSHEQAAYLLFTSGSTGVPKGVMATHRATLNRLHWMWRVQPYKNDDVLCHKTTCSFVDSIAEVWAPLLTGHPLVIASEMQALDLFEFVNMLSEHKVTRLTLVPSLLLSMLDHYPELGESLPAMRSVICSGETLREDLVRRFYAAFENAQLINLYGSTEVAADVCFYRVPDDLPAGKLVPIGRPVDNCQIYVLDQYLNSCPVGVAGELCVGGDQVAMAYFGDPRLTAEKFIPDPFSLAGARLFCTNDQARFGRDAELEYLGRRDNQIKMRGFRIHLDEVQNQLNQHPDVLDSVVVFRPGPQAVAATGDNDRDSVLIAYVVLEDIVTRRDGADWLRSYLRRHLPDYMVPKYIQPLQNFPLLENGKIDLKRLPEPDMNQLSSAGYSEPGSETEKQLVSIWQKYLNVPRIGINDNFFDLGGHSIIATRVAVEVGEEFQLDIHVQDIFTYLNIAELAQHIENLRAVTQLSNTAEGLQEEGEIFEF